MRSSIRVFVGTVLVVAVPPFVWLVKRMRKRDPREYGLTPQDRDFEIDRKFGSASAQAVDAMLRAVDDPTDPVLGAIVFLANRPDEVAELVALANTDRPRLLNAAVVKEERG